MYGSIARMHIKPGTKDEVIARLRGLQNEKIAGAVATYLYEVEAESAEYYMVLVFENKEAYLTYTSSAEQQAPCLDMFDALEGPPEWHVGEIVCAVEFEYSGI